MTQADNNGKEINNKKDNNSKILPGFWGTSNLTFIQSFFVYKIGLTLIIGNIIKTSGQEILQILVEFYYFFHKQLTIVKIQVQIKQ